MNLSNPLKTANDLLALGEIEKAHALAAPLFEANPDDSGLASLMGRLALAVLKPNIAAPLLERAVAAAPNDGVAQLALGRALRALDRPREAKSALEAAVLLMPKDADAHFQLGELLEGEGEAQAARACYEASQKLAPDLAAIPLALARIEQNQGHHEAAESLYRQAIALEDSAHAHTALAGLLAGLGRLDESISEFDAAVRLDPKNPQAWNNLSGPLKLRGRLKDSVQALRKAVALAPGNALIHNNLALALRLEEGCSEALSHAQLALQLRPDYADAYLNLGYILNLIGQHEAAIDALKRAISIEPGNAVYHGALGHVLNGQGAVEAAVDSFRRSLELDPTSALVRSNLLMTLCYSPDITPEDLFQEHQRFGQIHQAQPTPAAYANVKAPDKRLRIGYVSPDFRTHSVSYFFEPVLDSHDRQNVEVALYANHLHGDAVSLRMQAKADLWREIRGLNDSEAAALIRSDGIDILLDLAGHSADNRLLLMAKKPAPLQGTWIGYPNTTGLRAIDFRFTDAVADPPGLCDSLHTEKLVRLPNGFLCFQPPEDAPDIAPIRPRAPGQAIFGCFNNHAKVSPYVTRLWAEILKALPESVLMLKNRSMDDPRARSEILERFASHGIALERIKTVGRIPGRGGHLAAYNLVDISLDTHPYSGTATTCESLWMGTPVVTLAGKTHVSRVSASLLARVGLDDLVAESPEAYVALAVSLALDHDRLAGLRNSLRPCLQASPLLDAKACAASVEQAYRRLWQDYCANSA
ncbi:MAG: tetratricopeptide repeat protein [Alphaproteobacteria bacterium]|nr:tetratricopeptide repeat protein [Alphaproteobacteria bacterium]